MIEELAVVTCVEDNKITVESQIKSTCSDCHQLDNCGSGQVAKAFPQKRLAYEVSSEIAVKVGDEVVIGVAQNALLQSAWQVYGWPLIALIIGALLGQKLVEHGIFDYEFIAILFAVICGYLGMKAASYSQNLLSKRDHLIPKIVRIASKKIAVTQIP